MYRTSDVACKARTISNNTHKRMQNQYPLYPPESTPLPFQFPFPTQPPLPPTSHYQTPYFTLISHSSRTLVSSLWLVVQFEWNPVEGHSPSEAFVIQKQKSGKALLHQLSTTAWGWDEGRCDSRLMVPRAVQTLVVVYFLCFRVYFNSIYFVSLRFCSWWWWSCFGFMSPTALWLCLQPHLHPHTCVYTCKYGKVQ